MIIRKNEDKLTKQFGLIGYPLTHSFSPSYFAKKFEKEGIQNCSYKIFPLQKIEDFTLLIKQEQNLCGLNVTIPYKEKVIPLLDELDPDAEAIGAVNTILFKDGCTKGFNTDLIGFRQSISPLLDKHHTKALILGNGGAAKAVAYVLKQMNISLQLVSRTPKKGLICYQDVNEELIEQYPIIVNTTPLGMSPKEEEYPALPYHALNSKHLLYDLIYNPTTTRFLNKGFTQGTQIKNGLDMLHLQAEASWQIWNQ